MTAPDDDMTAEEWWMSLGGELPRPRQDEEEDVGDSRPETVMPFPVIPDDDVDDIDPDEIPSL